MTPTRSVTVRLAVAICMAILAAAAARPALAQSDDEGSILRIGEDVRVKSGEVIDGDVRVLFADLTVDEGGQITGDAVVVLGDALVDGEVDGDLTTSGDLTLGSAATIGGSATVLGELTGNEDAVAGQLVVPDQGRYVRPGESDTSARMPRMSRQEKVAYSLATALVSALVVMLLVALTKAVAPTPTARVEHGMRSSPVASFALGCVSWIVFPVLLFAIAITIIGLIPAFIMLIGWVVLLLLGWTALSVMIGSKILSGRGVASAVLGAFLLSLLVYGVSVLGWVGVCTGSFIGLVLSSAPLGAALRTTFGTRWWPAPPADLAVTEGTPPPPDGGAGGETVPGDDGAPPAVPPSGAETSAETGALPDVPAGAAAAGAVAVAAVAADDEPGAAGESDAAVTGAPADPAPAADMAAPAADMAAPAADMAAPAAGMAAAAGLAAEAAADDDETLGTSTPAVGTSTTEADAGAAAAGTGAMTGSGAPAAGTAAAAAASSAAAPTGELTQIPGITPVYALLLRQAGIGDVTALAAADVGRVMEIASPPGVTPIDSATAERWIQTAKLMS